MLDDHTSSPAPNPPKDALLISGCVFAPFVLLSAFGIALAITDGNQGLLAGFAAFQIIALAAIWARLWKAASRRAMWLGILIGIGLYLLTIGVCAAVL